MLPQPALEAFFMQKSYYFQHDYNASNDAKVLFLRQQLGMEGYGIYWFVLEQLAQSGGFLPLKIIPVLAMQTQTQETKVRAVIEGYELFQIIDKQFFSARLNEHLDIRKHLSEQGKKGAELRWGNRGAIREGISDPNAKERKGKEIKESKVESKPNRFTPPTLEEVINRMVEKLDDFTAQGEAQKFLAYYESNGWMVGKNKMKKWEAAAAGWVSRINNYKTEKKIGNGAHQQPPTGSKASQQSAAASRLAQSVIADFERTRKQGD